MIDEIDKQILNLLKDNARISNAEIAKRIEKAPSAVLERIRKLEKKGIIEGYETRINSKNLGLNLKTIVLIKTDENVGSMALGDQLAKIDEVQEVLCLAGEYSYLCKVNVKDTDAQSDFLVKLGAIPGVVDSITTLVLKSIKEGLSVKI